MGTAGTHALQPDLPYTYTVRRAVPPDRGTGGGEVAAPARVWIFEIGGFSCSCGFDGHGRHPCPASRFAIYVHGAPGGSAVLEEPVAGRSLTRPGFGFSRSGGFHDPMVLMGTAGTHALHPDLPYTYTVRRAVPPDRGTGGGEVAPPARVWIFEIGGFSCSYGFIGTAGTHAPEARFSIEAHDAPGWPARLVGTCQK